MDARDNRFYREPPTPIDWILMWSNRILMMVIVFGAGVACGWFGAPMLH